MNPRFSVLLPTHNRADVIGFAIRSVLEQTEPALELLVVGDGCTDGTADVVGSFGDPRIRWFDLPKAPTFGYANRNRVLRQARGDLIAFVGHDDLLLPDHLAVFADTFRNGAVEWAYSRPTWVSDEGLIVPFAVDLRRPAELETVLGQRNTVPPSCVVYRRECHERYGYWPEDLAGAADWEFWKRMIRPSGGANLAYERRPTALVFRASWRDRRGWAPDPLPLWLEWAASSWPAALTVPVADGEQAQAALSRLLAADPAGWPQRLRTAVDEVMDDLAWDSAMALSRIRATGGARVPPVQLHGGRSRTRRRMHRLMRRAARFLQRLGRQARLRLRGNPLFDATWYADRYPDRDGLSPYRHWRQRGWRSGHDPNPMFSTSWYLAHYPGVAARGTDPLDDYYVSGAFAGRDPGPDFDSSWYVAAYPDVDSAGTHPLLHYLRRGRAEGRLPKAGRPGEV